MKPVYGTFSPAEGPHIAGICIVQIAPREWLSESLIFGFNTGKVIQPVSFIAGKDWITIQLLQESYEYTEKPKSNASGTYYEISLTGTTNDLPPDLYQILETFRYSELLVLFKDQQGRYRIAGDSDKAMLFQYDNKETNSTGGLQQLNVTLSMESEDPAPFYDPAAAASDISTNTDPDTDSSGESDIITANIESSGYSDGDASGLFSIEFGCNGGNVYWNQNDLPVPNGASHLADILDQLVNVLNDKYGSSGVFSVSAGTIVFTPDEAFSFTCGNPVFSITIYSSDTPSAAASLTATIDSAGYEAGDTAVQYTISLGCSGDLFLASNVTLASPGQTLNAVLQQLVDIINASLDHDTQGTVSLVGNYIVFSPAASFTYSCGTPTFTITVDGQLLGQVRITSTMPGVSLTNLYGIGSFSIYSGSLPLLSGQTVLATHSAFSGSISFELSGNPIIKPSNVSLKVNDVTVDCVQINTSGGTFAFDSMSYDEGDNIEIFLNTGGCP